MTSPAIAKGLIDSLMGQLSTQEDALDEAKALVAATRATIVKLMEENTIPSHRSVWGLASLTSKPEWRFTNQVKLLELNVKAEKDRQKITGEATSLEGAPFLRVTWSK